MPIASFYRVIRCFLVLSLAFTPLAIMPVSEAKPMMSPSDQEAVGANWIVEAEYTNYHAPQLVAANPKDGNQLPKIVGYKKSNKFEYFEPPHAQYKVIKFLKNSAAKSEGPRIGQMINVPYQFHDGSACTADPDWKFSDSLMPAKGSKWILFLKSTDPHFGPDVFDTYRGDYGRWAATEENFTKVKKLLQQK